MADAPAQLYALQARQQREEALAQAAASLDSIIAEMCGSFIGSIRMHELAAALVKVRRVLAP